jgi:hypothetical protein
MTGAPAVVGKQASRSPLTRRLPGTTSGALPTCVQTTAFPCELHSRRSKTTVLLSRDGSGRARARGGCFFRGDRGARSIRQVSTPPEWNAGRAALTEPCSYSARANPAGSTKLRGAIARGAVPDSQPARATRRAHGRRPHRSATTYRRNAAHPTRAHPAARPPRASRRSGRASRPDRSRRRARRASRR